MTIIVAMIISKLGEKGKPWKNIIDVLNDVVMAGIMYIMWLVPIGVASLISEAIFTMDTDMEETMNQVAWYFATVFIGLMVQVNRITTGSRMKHCRSTQCTEQRVTVQRAALFRHATQNRYKRVTTTFCLVI